MLYKFIMGNEFELWSDPYLKDPGQIGENLAKQ